ncbi:MAG: hypothetical protein L0Z53_04115 [Acidobacteriales bacterium]|nr:hypothetical protein [Terriglobales bacterium]
MARQIGGGIPRGPVLSSTGELIPPEQALIRAVTEPLDRLAANAKRITGKTWEIANTPLADLAFGEGKTRQALVGNVDGMIAAAQREMDQRAARGEQVGYWDALKTVGLLGAGRSAADTGAGFTTPFSLTTFGLGGVLPRAAKAAQALRSGVSELGLFGRLANMLERNAPAVNRVLAESAPALRNTQTAISGVFGAKGAYDAGKNAPAALQGDPAALERMLGGLSTSAFGGAGVADRFRIAHVPMRDLPNEVLPANASVVASNYTGPGLTYEEALRIVSEE